MANPPSEPPSWLRLLSDSNPKPLTISTQKDGVGGRKRKSSELHPPPPAADKGKGKEVATKKVVPKPVTNRLKGTTLRIGTPPGSPKAHSAASPPPSSVIPKHAIWVSGLPSEIQDAVCPPESFASANPFTPEELKTIEELRLSCIKTAGLTDTLQLLKKKYIRCCDDLSASREGKKKTHAELLKVTGEYSQLKEKHDKSAADLTTAQESLAQLREEYKKLQEEHASDRTSLSALKVTYESVTKKVNSLEKDVSEAYVQKREALIYAETCRAELSKSVTGSFFNGVKQVQLLNPDALLNLVGLKPRGYIANGVIIQVGEDSPTHTTTQNAQAAATEGGEEVMSKIKPVTEVIPPSDANKEGAAGKDAAVINV